jgi:hypothetical protein
MHRNPYLVTSVYMRDYLSIKYDTPLHKLFEQCPELQDIAQKLEDALGVENVHNFDVFDNSSFEDLRSLNLTLTQKQKLLEIAAKVRGAEIKRKRAEVRVPRF